MASSTVTYSRNQLFKIRRIADCTLAEQNLADLKRSGLFHSRGRRAGGQDFISKIKAIISNRAAIVRNTRSASWPVNRVNEVYGVNKTNVIFIPCGPQLPNCQQPLKFVLFNARSIHRKTLLVNNYILEHNIDLLTIAET